MTVERIVDHHQGRDLFVTKGQRFEIESSEPGFVNARATTPRRRMTQVLEKPCVLQCGCWVGELAKGDGDVRAMSVLTARQSNGHDVEGVLQEGDAEDGECAKLLC